MKKKWAFCVFVFVAVLFVAGTVFLQKKNKNRAEIKEFTAFFDVPGLVKDPGNEIMDKIAEITGARCQEIWLVGQTADDAIASYIASGEYADFF